MYLTFYPYVACCLSERTLAVKIGKAFPGHVIATSEGAILLRRLPRAPLDVARPLATRVQASSRLVIHFCLFFWSQRFFMCWLLRHRLTLIRWLSMLRSPFLNHVMCGRADELVAR